MANSLFAYLCPVCACVEINATRRANPYHERKVRDGWRYRWQTHALQEAGTFDAALGLDEIKARVLAGDWAQGVREIESVSMELGAGMVVRQPAKVKRWRRYM